MHKKRLVGAMVAMSTIAVLVTGCAANHGGSSKTQNANTLTLAIGSAPQTLDPALFSNGDPQVVITDLAYEPLIYMKPDGSYGPGLATSWKYVGNNNTEFQIELRKGVKFADGTDVTADAVKQWLEYFGKAGGAFASRIANMSSIDVTGPLSIDIKLKTPDPNLPYEFSQRSVTGDVVSPNALKDPKSLGTTTAGAGQYVLDTADTTTGQVYTFTPNAKYWNQKAIQWKKVVVKIIADPNAQLQAMQSGQVDYIIGTPDTADAAKKSGFQVLTEPYTANMMMLFDRNGTTVPALGKQEVRQALQYAIDRKAITKALYGSYGEASPVPSLPGQDGYSASLESKYPYDPAKAKKMLADAGYADGFTMPMIAYNLNLGVTDAAQAIASELAKIGVKVDITVPTSFSDFVSNFGTAPSTVMFYGVNPMSVNATDWFSETGWSNPEKVVDPEIQSLMAQANADPNKTTRDAAYAKATARLMDLSWFVPIAREDKIVIARQGLNVEMSKTYLDPDPVFFTRK